MSELYHYTCDHGHDALGEFGHVRSRFDRHLRPFDELAYISWFTDLDHPIPGPLGLTSQILTCDRTAHRYIVCDEAPEVYRYMDKRHLLSHTTQEGLESAPGAMPMHWHVAVVPIAVAYHPPEIRGVNV